MVFTNVLPALAQDSFGPGNVSMGGPSAAEIQKMMQEGQQQAQSQMGQPGMPSAQNSETGQIAAPTQDQIEAMMKQGQEQGGKGQMPTNVAGFDLSKMKVPDGGEGMMPNFGGMKLGAGNPMAAKLGEVLDQINGKLTEAEDNTKELSDGQVKGADGLNGNLKKAREAYNQARAAYLAGDYAGAGTLLNSMPKPPTSQDIEKLGISTDLINDARNKLKAASANIDQNISDPAEATNAKAEILAAMGRLDEADAKLKSGDKKGATAIMMELKKLAPADGANEAAGNFGKIPASKLKQILEMVATKITEGEAGLKKAASSGIAIDQEATDKMAQGKEILTAAQTAFDLGDISTAAAKLKELQSLDMEKYFATFRDKIMPKSRMQSILKEGQNGVKALKLTIEHAKTFGMETSEIESLLGQLEPLINKAAEVIDKDTNMFLQYMVMADQLRVNDKVNEIILKTANLRAKSLVADGLVTINAGLDDLQTAVQALSAKKVNISNAQEVLDHARAKTQEAQAKYDAGEYMEAGKILDQVVDDFVSLSNIAKDVGLKLTPEQTQAMAAAVGAGRKNQSLVGVGATSATQDLLNKANSGDVMDINNTLMKFNPELLDRVTASRGKDKEMINNIMRDVMPLIPEDQRAKTMDGKLGIMSEAKLADATIAGLKKITGVKADVIKMLGDTKAAAANYTFSPEIASAIEAKLADFNDKVQSGEIKDPKMIAAYAKTLAADVNSAVKTDNADKFKEGLIPAKNIDDNNPIFADAKYLQADGALKADKNGSINLDKIVTRKELADMVNNTADKKIASLNGNGALTIAEAIKAAAQAYNINVNNPKDMAQQLGVSANATDMNKKATMKNVIEIVAGADQRWGAGAAQ